MDILITIGFFILAIGAPVGCVFCYRQGLKDGQAVKEEKPIPKIAEPKEKPTEETQEIIDHFDKLFNYDYLNPEGKQ